MIKLTGIEAMREVAKQTAGTFDRKFWWYSQIQGRRYESSHEDISWNVLNWVGHTGLDSLLVFKSAGGVLDIELWDESMDSQAPQITYVITTDEGTNA